MFSTVDNRVQLIGYLGQDLDVKELGSDGKKFARVSLATHENRKDDEGRRIVVTTWHKLVAWGRNAEIMARVFNRGDRLYIEGKLSYRDFVDAEGHHQGVTEIVVSDFKKLEHSNP